MGDAIHVGAPPTFLDAVGAWRRMRSGRLTPSRKVGQRKLVETIDQGRIKL